MNCKECETNICDFCIFYNFNADSDGCYIDNGYCKKLNKTKDPSDFCKHFICAVCNPKVKVRKK